MENQSNIKKMLLMFSVAWLVFLIQPMQTQASGVLVVGEKGRHHNADGYLEVRVSGDRYYYNQGSFYTGYPGSYVIVEPPPGAIIYELPGGYEQIMIDGNIYFRYHEAYYRPLHRGRYQVVRIKDFHDRGQHRGWDHDKGDHGHKNGYKH